jgi:hypothetical protein
MGRQGLSRPTRFDVHQFSGHSSHRKACSRSGGARSVVAESVLVTQQLLILNRSRKRSPNLPLADRLVVGVSALLVRPGRLIRSAIVLKPSTLLSLHRVLTKRKYLRLFSRQVRKKPGPKGPIQEVMAAVVEMKRRNPTWGCPRIAQQIALAFGIPINKDVVRRILAARYQPKPDSAGPFWQQYYNGYRAHAGLEGRTPEPSMDAGGARASVCQYRWRPHCGGLYQTPIAA